MTLQPTVFDWAENKDSRNRQAIGKKLYKRKKPSSSSSLAFHRKKKTTYLTTKISFDREAVWSCNQPCLIKPKIRIFGIDKRLVRNFTKEKNAIFIVARVTSQTKSNLPADDDIFWPGGRIQLQPTVFDWAENKDNHNKKESVRNFSKVKKS